MNQLTRRALQAGAFVLALSASSEAISFDQTTTEVRMKAIYSNQFEQDGTSSDIRASLVRDTMAEVAHHSQESLMAEKASTKSPLDLIKEHQDAITKLAAQVKKDTLAQVQQGISDLNELGFNYELVDRDERRTPAAPKKAASGGTRQLKDAPCPVCNFKTVPPHDSRSHRSQQEKKPFTEDELAQRSMQKAA